MEFRRLTALYQFTDRLYRSSGEEDIYRAALDAICAGLQCSRASILLFDGANPMQFVASRGLSTVYRETVAGFTPWARGEIDPQPITVADIENARELEALKPAIRSEGIAALAFVPLVINRGVIGKFMIYHDRPHVFTDEEIDLALTIARQLGFAIERQRARTSRKKVEADLRESEERFRAIVDTTPECVKLVARDGTLLHMNASGLGMIGADCFEMVEGQSVYDVIASEDRERFRTFNEQVCDGARGSLEFDIVSLTGVRRHMETHAAPFRNSDGQVVQLAVTRDISARRRAEEGRRRRDAEFRALADNMHQLAWMTEADGWIYWYNKRWFDYTGTTLEEMQGWGWRKVHHPDHVERVTEKFKRCIEAGEDWEDTFPLLGADGAYRWFLSRALPIRDETGAVVRWFGTNTDITERLSAFETRQRLISIVEDSDDAIISKDLNGIINSWNQGAERLFGYTPDEIIGRSVLTLIPPEYQHEEPTIIGRISRGERIDHYETVRRRKDGSNFFVSLTVSPMKDADGNIVGASKIARDISERRRADEQRTLLINELNHRVKNTLATVQSLAMQTLRHTERSEDARALFESRLAALSRAHDLLTRQSWAGADLRDVAERALAPFKVDATRIRIDGPGVRLSPQRALALSIAIHELATNAAKYGALSNDEGVVRLSWKLEGNAMLLDWIESGGPPVSPPKRSGFGTRLIERGLSRELGGEARIDYDASGVRAIISAELDALART